MVIKTPNRIMKQIIIITHNIEQDMPSFFIILCLLLCSVHLQGQVVDDTKYLETDKIIEGNIKVQQQDEYWVDMNKNQTAIIRVERGSFDLGKEINLLITIIAPDNSIIDEINTANDASFIIFDSSISGDHKVIVRRWNGAESGGQMKAFVSLEIKN